MSLLKLLRFNQQRIQQVLRERVESVPESSGDLEREKRQAWSGMKQA